MQDRLRGSLYLCLAMLTVGSTVVASKLIASGLPPFTATALRFALALPVFVVMARATQAVLPRPPKRDGVLLIVQAAAGSVGYTVLLIAGTAIAPAADAAVVLGTLPVVAALFAVFALGERPGMRVVGAIVLAGAGVAMVTVSGSVASDDRRSLLGMALVMGAVVCEAAFILLNKRLSRPIAPLPLSTIMCGLGLAISLPLALLERPWNLPVAPVSLVATGYYALVPTVLGFLLWYAGAARVSGSEAALHTAIAPVAGLALAAVVLGEPLTLQHTLGAALVIAAVVVVAARPSPPT